MTGTLQDISIFPRILWLQIVKLSTDLRHGIHTVKVINLSDKPWLQAIALFGKTKLPSKS